MKAQEVDMNLNRIRSISNSEMWSNMITRESLLQLYNERVSGGDNYDSFAAEFVDIFGGIHQIIETHLRCPDILLTYTQLDRIEQILSSETGLGAGNGHHNGYHSTIPLPGTDSKRKTASSLNPINRLKRSLSTNHVDTDETLMTYVFDPDDRWLSDRLVKIVFHDAALSLFVISKIIYYVIFLIDSSNVYTIFYNFFCRCFFYIPWFVMAIMSTNRETRKLLYHSFDFWMEGGWGVIYCVAGVLLQAQWWHISKQLTGIPVFFNVIYHVIAPISMVLWILFTASFDALPMISFNWRMVLSVFAALNFTVYSVYWQFLWHKTLDYEVHITSYSSISMVNLLQDGSKLLAIFFWKQCWQIFRKRDRCISIQYSPYIRWERNKHRRCPANSQVMPQSEWEMDWNEEEDEGDSRMKKVHSESIATYGMDVEAADITASDTEEMESTETSDLHQRIGMKRLG